MQRIAVMTSGGDAPGMNAAVRAVTRRALARGMEVTGIRRGYWGLLRSEWVPLTSDSVHDIIHRGGTVLLTGRCDAFRAAEGQGVAVSNLREVGIEALVCIGGDGSLRGCCALQAQGFPTIGIPGTVDNDLAGTDATIGFDTAVNTAVEAIDRIRDTAAAHERTFVVQVMGRDAGCIALATGMACGAETILVPEIPWTAEGVCRRLRRGVERGRRQNVIVMAEGAGDAMQLGARIERDTQLETRVSILGHIQRGGSPTAVDRNLASRLGALAVDLLVEGHHGLMVGVQGGTPVGTPLQRVIAARRPLDPRLHALATALSAW